MKFAICKYFIDFLKATALTWLNKFMLLMRRKSIQILIHAFKMYANYYLWTKYRPILTFGQNVNQFLLELHYQNVN